MGKYESKDIDEIEYFIQMYRPDWWKRSIRTDPLTLKPIYVLDYGDADPSQSKLKQRHFDTLKEYRRMRPLTLDSIPSFSEPKYSCIECGGGMCKDNTVVLATYPPKYKYVCNNCGHVENLDW